MPSPLNTAVLFIIFNRPEFTRLVFNEIKNAKPKKLYVAIDGPRSGNPSDAEKCAESLAIASALEWDCELAILHREKNLGCKFAVSGAIDWFFEHEDEGIILEDDVVPLNGFFKYCEELLEFYREDSRVGSITGCNPVSAYYSIDGSYDFTIYNYIWGWATWKRAWSKYDLSMSKFPAWLEQNKLKNLSNGSREFEKYWSSIFWGAHNGKVNTWDAQWAFTCWENGFLCAMPTHNQIENIGFNQLATHTKGNLPKYLKDSIPMPLDHPIQFRSVVESNKNLDQIIFNKAFKVPLYRKVGSRLKSFFPRNWTLKI